MTQVGTPSEFQKKNRILVSCIAMYQERPLGLKRLIESCEKFGVQLTLFGEGQQFINMYESKLQYLGECLYKVRNDYDYVINVDANDSLILRPINGILLDRVAENKMVFAAEKNCFPFKQLEVLYSQYREYPFINGGGFLSSMEVAVRSLLYLRGKRAIDPTPPIENEFTDYYKDDQGAFSYEYVAGDDFLYPDTNAYIFQTLCLVNQDEEFEFKGSGLKNIILYNKKTGTNPFILHANGSADYTNIYNKIIKNG